jgi:hypothetical protein
MGHYRKKPIVIEAHQLPEAGGDFSDELLDFLYSIPEDVWYFLGNKIAIKTLEGEMTASPGDWIIRGVQGELYPCKPDIFEATYEPVEAV